MAHFAWYCSLTWLVFGHAAASSLSKKDQVQEIQWVNCTDFVPSTLVQSELPSPLPTTLHCGNLVVPMDYSKGISPSNNITISFAMRRPDNPKGLINYSPGGPGGEANSFAWAFALNISSEAFGFTGLEDFDFVAIDVRGTEFSNPINCTSSEIIPSFIPSTQAQFDEIQNITASIYNACEAQSTPQGILNFLRSEDLASDWDSVRAALGYDITHLLGLSYGSLTGAIYASKFPQRVGRFVLDGIASTNITIDNYVVNQVKAYNRLLLRADAYCLNDTTCPFHSLGKGAIPEAFQSIIANATAGDFPNVNADDIRAVAALSFFAGSPNFTAFNLALADAIQGDASSLTYSGAFATEYSAGLIAILPLFCSDILLSDTSFDAYAKILSDVAAVDTFELRFSQILSLAAFCDAWPLHGDVTGPHPDNSSLMLVTSDFDLNTPTENVIFQRGDTPNSVVVRRHGEDHGSYYVPGPVRDVEIAYLTTGVFPEATNQTFISVFEPGQTIPGPEDPYAVPVGPAAGEGFSPE
ncbi:hypothetical protein BT96DRAFT_880708 [Gymnopus androsaceus JB14]|uniref:Alpha/beta-hydrolase n=1 Tax=Gymnopus androsaceus JB14 TaxID=1447944 RepID=A0A6A4HW22_9AGAR|nr:hypothetical protein BT96DRAFT_880708 [Gymnopus androsaceus JB14]